jgi:ornithine cyclodeaminase
MAAVEDAFHIYESRDFFMPDRVHIDKGQKTLLYMPCMAGAILGTKYLTLFPENIPKGLPTIYGLMILNDFETGKPLCILDGKTLTALRTGAVGGTGIRYTTPETITSVGLVGAGVQGYHQLMYAARVRDIKTVCLYDVNTAKLPAYAESLQKILRPGTRVEICKDTTELLAKCELIITATTSNIPVLPDNAKALRGKHFIGIGSYKPFMREYPDALCMVVDNLFIDTEIAKEETGDLARPLESGLLTEDRVRSFGEYILRGTDKEAVKNSTTLFKSVGMALFDVVIAEVIYRKAEQGNIGHTVTM